MRPSERLSLMDYDDEGDDMDVQEVAQCFVSVTEWACNAIERETLRQLFEAVLEQDGRDVN